MINIDEIIAPVTDRLTGDALLLGSVVIKITSVKEKREGKNLKLVLGYEGDDDKPYITSKGMARVIVNAWGKPVENYVGRYLKLFREPTVMYGGQEVGGVQISEASHIDRPVAFPLRISKTKVLTHTIKPLKQTAPPVEATTEDIELLITSTGTDRQKFLEYFKVSEVDDLTSEQKQKAVEILKKKGKK